jgi:hypothetical protein
MTVHHIEVDHPGTRTKHLRELFAEASVVSRQDGRLDATLFDQFAAHERYGYTGLSIEPPQRTQVMFAVSLIRTIVECSPQLGQCDISWKRTRQ